MLCTSKHAMTEGPSRGEERTHYVCSICRKERLACGFIWGCRKCDQNVCAWCNGGYEDMTFALHLGTEPQLRKYLPVYKEDPGCAEVLCAGSCFMAPIYGAFQRFYKNETPCLVLGCESGELECAVDEAMELLAWARDAE